jgi:UDP-N-acetylmuramoyl-L-alanyl-D-glutamate--2,6-diaminopimelate ligase
MQKLEPMSQNPPHVYSIPLKDISSLLTRHGILKKSYSCESLPSNLVTLSTDSRKASETCGFIAYLGVASDGHAFIKNALSAKVAFIICEKEPDLSSTKNTPIFLVSSGRAAWSVLTAAACGNPHEKLRMLGVTGTNGKTSTAWMTRQLLHLVGEKTVMIGTIGAWIGEEFHPTKHTTPDPDFFYPILKRAVDEGAKTCIMEVSSHAIAQEKLTPVMFDAAAFTSFSRDHLDFHKDEEDYWSTKCRLFESMTKQNGSMFFCSGLTRLPKKIGHGKPLIYGPAHSEDKLGTVIPRLKIEVSKESFDGSTVSFVQENKVHRGDIPFFGAHAIENFTAALLMSSTVSNKVWNSEHWQKVNQVPGRLEKIAGKDGRVAFVDYAHTPDALEKTLIFLQKYRTSELIVVFGCGGDRDAGKRPIMGQIAQKFADKVYVTSDNPRTENPQKIISDITNGLDKSSKQKLVEEPDRNLAIKRAVQESKSNAMILIAGKGHESYQIIGDKVLNFDDREVARMYLN